MEERLFLNLTTQPRFTLLGDDPYKSVSVAQRRCSKWYPCLENSLWRHMLRAHRGARLGENELILSLCQIFFCLSCGMCYNKTLHSFSHSIWKQLFSSPLAGQFVQLSLIMSQSILKSVLCPHELDRCNSPRSCCPGESWWGCCWGWTRGCVPLWSGEPLLFLRRLGQFWRRELCVNKATA